MDTSAGTHAGARCVLPAAHGVEEELAQFGLPGGNPHHADLTLSQLFFRRPVPGFADHTSPVRGLFLCSASNHPGGGVTGVPGYNAARVVLKKLGKRGP